MTSNQRGGFTVTTRRLAGTAALLSWLPSPHGALSWVKGGAGLVGWGQAARFTARGTDRFTQARRWWSQLSACVAVHDGIGVPGTGLVAFASLAFADHPGDSVLIVPRVVIGCRGGESWITTTGGPAPDPQPVAAPQNVRYQAGIVDDAAHRRAVAAAIARIRAGELSKVVLARDLVAAADGPFDERYLLARLAENFPDCWVFAVNGLVGATPELLLRREDRAVSALLLAGTAWPGPGVAGPSALARELLGSAKDRSEHEHGVRSLAEALAPFCSQLEVPAGPSVLHLPNVTHLATQVRGRLKAATSLLELTGRVHPTAAVAGTPTATAVQLISDLEGMDRGGYLGPVGWIDAHGNGEFGVALRCAQIRHATARLFAGGGIVASSKPATEAAEAAAKFRAFQSALAPLGPTADGAANLPGYLGRSARGVRKSDEDPQTS